MRRIISAFAVFAIAGGLCAITEAKKPIKVAVLHEPQNAPVAQQKETPPPPKEKPKPRAHRYLPVHDFGGY
jgi:hypothetical protein